MTISNGYGDLTTFRARYSIPTGTDVNTQLESVITAVSRKIDQVCNRRFWQSASDEARYYRAEFGDLLRIDDMIAAPTEVAVDVGGNRTFAQVWASTDYDLEPYNAPLEAIARPYTQLRRTPTGSYAFPVGLPKGVRITGKFGFCTLANVPAEVVEACYLQAIRLFKRKDAVFGVMGSADLGQMVVIPKLDPDVMFMLEDFVRPRGMRGV